jgi:hypothetical protein
VIFHSLVSYITPFFLSCVTVSRYYNFCQRVEDDFTSCAAGMWKNIINATPSMPGYFQMRHLAAVTRRCEEFQLLFQHMRNMRSFAAAARLWFARISSDSILLVILHVRR